MITIARPAPPTPSLVYFNAQTRSSAPTLSASQLASLDSGAPPEEEDDTRSFLSGTSITPSDSASVAFTNYQFGLPITLTSVSWPREKRGLLIVCYQHSNKTLLCQGSHKKRLTCYQSAILVDLALLILRLSQTPITYYSDTLHGAPRCKHETSHGSLQPRKKSHVEPPMTFP